MSRSLLDFNPKYRFHMLSREQQGLMVHEEFGKLLALDQSNFDFSNFKVATLKDNQLKNRYGNVFPFDSNVFPRPGTSSHYIGASLIPEKVNATTGCPNFTCPHTFMCANAPPPDNFFSWFEVIKGTGCKLVVMLTQVIEGGAPKAEAYWPEKIGESVVLGAHGSKVSLQSETYLEGSNGTIVERVLSYVSDGNPETKPYSFRQLQYKEWPDHGVPTKVEGFVSVLKQVQAEPPQAPVMVHCSAGIGRTGTLIATYQAMELAKTGDLRTESLFSIVEQLKMNRWGMVQRKEQYGFVFNVITHLLQNTPAPQGQ